MAFFVYIIQSKKDGTYYIGSTSNLEDRLARHNAGRSRFTKSKLPWNLVFKEAFELKTDALRRENQIKKRKSREYIQRLIDESSSG